MGGKRKDLDINQIINLYKDNWSASKISRLLKVDVVTITSRLRENNIEVKKHRKYLINKNYFSKINDQNKSYWLGFLMADGYNSDKYIRIDIQDNNHLDKLRDEVYINNDMPVRQKKSKTGKTVYYLTIQDKQIIQDCEKWGIVNKKGFICQYPNIDVDYDIPFIRGVFDGDGSLSYSMDGNYRRYAFSIVGSKKIIKQVIEKISVIGVNVKFRKMKSIYGLYVRGNRQIIKVLEWLYNESDIHLDRKYEKYQDMLEWYKNKN